MLRLLADSESAIRRSANPRLIVETLLLRWTMLDRIVDLAQVLGAARLSRAAGRVARHRRRGPGGLVAAAPACDAGGGSPARTAPAAPAGSRGLPPRRRGPPCGERMPPRSRRCGLAGPSWSRRCARQSRFLGEALAATDPAEPGAALAHGRAGRVQPLVRGAVAGAGSGGGGGARAGLGSRPASASSRRPGAGGAGPAPRKLTEATLKADRLRGFRSKDPSLDTAADALDLEIVD